MSKPSERNERDILRNGSQSEIPKIKHPFYVPFWMSKKG